MRRLPATYQGELFAREAQEWQPTTFVLGPFEQHGRSFPHNEIIGDGTSPVSAINLLLTKPTEKRVAHSFVPQVMHGVRAVVPRIETSSRGP